MDVGNNPLTPAEYLTFFFFFLQLFPVKTNADFTNLLMQSDESTADSQGGVCMVCVWCVRVCAYLSGMCCVTS